MSGNIFIDWLGQSLSLSNVFLLAWLSLTILLISENRVRGVYFASLGAAVGVIFFAIHSFILYEGALGLLRNFLLLWHVGWVPLVVAPYAWYLVMLWYCGYWEDAISNLHLRQRVWFWLVACYGILLCLLLIINPLPNFYLETDEFNPGSLFVEIPLIFLTYPPFLYLCIILSLDGLLRPAATIRLMGDIARRRARPWLIGSSSVLLALGCIGGAILYWLVMVMQRMHSLPNLLKNYSYTLSWLDILISGMIFIASLLIGQAVVTYEVFTGNILPRRGLLKHWINALFFNIVFSCMCAGILVLPKSSSSILIIFLLILVAGILTLSIRTSLLEREIGIGQLRPFVKYGFLYPTIISSSRKVDSELDLSKIINSLCKETLMIKKGLIVPMGQMAVLDIEPIMYSSEGNLEMNLDAIEHSQIVQSEKGIILNPEKKQGFIWAEPLRNEWGIMGIFYLGEKIDGSYFSKEEIDLAHNSGARIIDLMFVTELTRRLVKLQRQKMTESLILDQKTRLLLHDDILPKIHTALLQLSSWQALHPDLQQTIGLLMETHQQISALLHDLPSAILPDIKKLGLNGALNHLIEREMIHIFDQVTWNFSPNLDEKIQNLSPLVVEVIYSAAREVIRNAAHHARSKNEQDKLNLSIAAAWKDGLELVIEDNGQGITSSKNSSETGGQGLALHGTLMAIIGGSLASESVGGEYTRIILFVPENFE